MQSSPVIIARCYDLLFAAFCFVSCSAPPFRLCPNFSYPSRWTPVVRSARPSLSIRDRALACSSPAEDGSDWPGVSRWSLMRVPPPPSVMSRDSFKRRIVAGSLHTHWKTLHPPRLVRGLYPSFSPVSMLLTEAVWTTDGRLAQRGVCRRRTRPITVGSLMSRVLNQGPIFGLMPWD